MKNTKKKNSPMKDRDYTGNIFISFFRIIKLGLTNFWRNKFLSFATIIVMAVIIFIFNVILAIQHVGNEALRSLSERVDIVLYLRDDIDFYSANRLSEDLEKISGVKEVKYTSKEEALQIVSKTHPKTADFLQKFNYPNPLPPSISITTERPEDYEKIQQFLGTSEYKNLLESYAANGSTGESIILNSVAQNLESISHFVRQTIFWMVLVFILGGTLIVVNAIQLTIYNRRQEIHIMRLVGATPNFIRMPFILEGVLYGIFAVIFSFVILLLISTSIQLDSSNLWSYYESLNVSRVFVIELVITMVLASISSLSATEQYIKGKLTINN